LKKISINKGRNLTLSQTIPDGLRAWTSGIVCGTEPEEDSLDEDESGGGSAEHVDVANAAKNCREATGNVEETTPQEDTESEEFSFTIAIATAVVIGSNKRYIK